MDNKPKVNLDMPLGKKAVAHKHVIKREVFGHDIGVRRKPQILKTVKQYIPKLPVYTVMPLPVKIAFSKTSLIVFAVIVCMVVGGMQGVEYLLNAKNSSGEILGAATSAYSDLDSASKNLETQNFSEASSMFESAQKSLSIATEKLDRFKLLTWIVPQANSAEHLLDGAYALAQGGEKLTKALELYNNLVVSSKGIENSNFAQTMQQSKADLEASLALFETASSHFNQANSIPDEYKESLKEAKNQVSTLTKVLKNMVALEDLYLTFLGNQDKTYLLVFQNYDEMRATGGFIGTYGILRITDGAIKELKIESIYNLDGKIYDQIAAPGPFQPDIKKWGIRDANWFVDFPTSASKLLEFFERGSQTADGVIAFTPKLFVDVLSVVGNISMSQYDTVLTPQNFQEVVQTKTSVEYDKELNQPKKFLADFAPILLNRMTNLPKDDWFKILEAINRNFVEKNIMLFSNTDDVQSKISELGFAGKILDTPHDYLAVFNTNLGGTKTDLEIDQKVDLTSTLNKDDSITNTVTVSRYNNSQELNKNFIRVLVPLGSKVISVKGFMEKPQFSSNYEGFEQDKDLKMWDQGEKFENIVVRTEANKTEFSGWIETQPITSSNIEITYTLPFKLSYNKLSGSATYSLLYQKQPGVLSADFKAVWNLNERNKVWASSNLQMDYNKAILQSDSKHDEYWSIIID